MKELFAFLKRFIRPYLRNLIGSVSYNLLSALLNVFSFALLIPILRILFKISTETYEYVPFSQAQGMEDLFNVLKNNFFYKITDYISVYGDDIRIQIYDKVLSLPMGFFSKERKGDIITRMSGDVSEIENSITQSLDMLIKNPILILVYLGTLVAISWQLTIFTLVIGPVIIWVMGSIGRKLKANSLVVQSFWSETMSELEETLGGLRVIKAFLAEDKMSKRFAASSEQLRKAANRVNMRQALAHPVSEFMGTALIVVVLWYGGTLILNSANAPIDGPTFIYYLTILYSVINPIKDFSKAGYAIPKGLASLERVDKILLAENNIKDPENPVEIDALKNEIKYEGVSFSYEDDREVLHDVNLTIPRGKTIALVGQSGSGKSTLVDLLPRFYDVTKGSITIDGKDIRDISLKSLPSRSLRQPRLPMPMTSLWRPRTDTTPT